MIPVKILAALQQCMVHKSSGYMQCGCHPCQVIEIHHCNLLVLHSLHLDVQLVDLHELGVWLQYVTLIIYILCNYTWTGISLQRYNSLYCYKLNLDLEVPTVLSSTTQNREPTLWWSSVILNCDLHFCLYHHDHLYDHLDIFA